VSTVALLVGVGVGEGEGTVPGVGLGFGVGLGAAFGDGKELAEVVDALLPPHEVSIRARARIMELV
jgi:hypothetical protein